MYNVQAQYRGLYTQFKDELSESPKILNMGRCYAVYLNISI